MSDEYFDKLTRYLAHVAAQQGYDFTQPQHVLQLIREQWDTITDEAALTTALGGVDDAKRTERIAVLEAELAELKARR